jgi:hypothetical protein
VQVGAIHGQQTSYLDRRITNEKSLSFCQIISQRRALSLKQINLDGWPKPEPAALKKWAGRVRRYSF